MTEKETPEGTRETNKGAREGAGPILGPNKTNEKEEKDGRTIEEVETKSRRILAGVRKHHTNHHRIVVRA